MLENAKTNLKSIFYKGFIQLHSPADRKQPCAHSLLEVEPSLTNSICFYNMEVMTVLDIKLKAPLKCSSDECANQSLINVFTEVFC